MKHQTEMGQDGMERILILSCLHNSLVLNRGQKPEENEEKGEKKGSAKK